MLPQGRIAMLFTDIEGSTRMVHDLGPVYADVLRDQRRLIRSAIAEFHGHEMGTEGDSFFVVFSTVEDALRTAVTAQRALVAHRWPGGGQVRVRMGLHVGEPARHEEGYVGVDLNRAARVASTSHGGQIVVSGEFHHEAVSVAIRELSFRDLGLHRLKDLPAPEHLYQVCVPDLPDITTAVKSLGAPSNLPGERNPLIGRDELVANLIDLLHEGERLVTLIGPGGVGKTSAALRIAREVSGDFIDGIYFVALEQTTTEDEAWAAIVSAIESSSSEESPETSAVRILGDRRVLLVLDNLEQLRAAAAVAVTLLERTSAVLLATSRGAVEVRGERPVVVPPLLLPEQSLVGAASVEKVLEGPAVALFAVGGATGPTSFALSADNVADVAEVCKRLDGLPLAIELAAARIRLLSPKRLLESLSAQLWLQSSEGDRPDRQRTLRGAIEWSFELLAEPEQQWFVALAVFEGGADLTAVEAIGPAVVGVPDAFTVVGELAHVGLVTLADAPDGGVRITMLTAVRELASALLQKGPETDAIARLHARHYTELAEDAEVNLRGPHQLLWADRVTLEQANLAVAFAWANNGSVDDRGLALRMASARWVGSGTPTVAPPRAEPGWSVRSPARTRTRLRTSPSQSPAPHTRLAFFSSNRARTRRQPACSSGLSSCGGRTARKRRSRRSSTASVSRSGPPVNPWPPAPTSRRASCLRVVAGMRLVSPRHCRTSVS